MPATSASWGAIACRRCSELPARNQACTKRGNLIRREWTREQRRLFGVRAEQVDDVVHALTQIAPVARGACSAAGRTRIVVADEGREELRRGAGENRRHRRDQVAAERP